MSSVPTTGSKSAAPLPAEFNHPSLQDLMRKGSVNGFVEAVSVRAALEAAALPLKRMKVVLRTLDQLGIAVKLPELSTRAIAASSRSSSATAESRVTAVVDSKHELPRDEPEVVAEPAKPPAKKAAPRKRAAKKAAPAAEQPVDVEPAKTSTPAPRKRSSAKKAAAPVAPAEGDVPVAIAEGEPVEVVPAPEPEAGPETSGFVITDDDDDAPLNRLPQLEPLPTQ